MPSWAQGRPHGSRQFLHTPGEGLTGALLKGQLLRHPRLLSRSDLSLQLGGKEPSMDAHSDSAPLEVLHSCKDCAKAACASATLHNPLYGGVLDFPVKRRPALPV